MQLDLGRALIWIGRRRDRPITYDDLLAAETRAFEAEEALADAERALTRACGGPPAATLARREEEGKANG